MEQHANINAYRLGDVFYHEWKEVNRSTINLHKNTIAERYLKNRSHKADLVALDQVVTETCRDVPAVDIAMHVRLGDVTCDKIQQAATRSPPEPQQLATMANDLGANSNGGREITIFHGEHTPDCKKTTDAYIENLAQTMDKNGVVFTWADPAHADAHLCQMIGAKTFVQGKGGYSAIIGNLRDEHGQETIRKHGIYEYKSVAGGGGTL